VNRVTQEEEERDEQQDMQVQEFPVKGKLLSRERVYQRHYLLSFSCPVVMTSQPNLRSSCLQNDKCIENLHSSFLLKKITNSWLTKKGNIEVTPERIKERNSTGSVWLSASSHAHQAHVTSVWNVSLWQSQSRVTKSGVIYFKVRIRFSDETSDE
jgi:hypothetical protein